MCESARVNRTVLVVGGGGREHALVRALARSPERPRIYCAGGNVGIAADAELIPLSIDDVGGVAALSAAYQADLVVVGPEAPLVAGLCDALRAFGIRAFGPSAAAARLEGSKAFAKEVMAAAGVPTARSHTVSDVEAGMAAVADLGLPVAIKADGLAAGKGVMVVSTEAEAREALELCLIRAAFGAAGARRRGGGGHDRPGGVAARDHRRQRRRPLPRRARLQADRRGQHRPQHRRAWARCRRCPTSRTPWPTI